MITGSTVVTRGIAAKIEKSKLFAQEVIFHHGRFLQKDWGDVSENDKEMNDLNATGEEGSLMGAYETSEGRIWIMTEHDRSVTTILFPDEY